jgi:membrane protein required for colicin V production
MNALDLVFIFVLIYGIFKGFIRGFVLEAASLIGVILGIYIAKMNSDRFGISLHEWFDLSTRYAKPIAYFLLFLFVILSCHFLAKILDKLVKLALLDWLNKLLGSVTGMLKYALILSVFLNVFHTIDAKVGMINNEKKDKSLLYHPIKRLVPAIMPFIAWEDFVKNENN